MKLWMIFNFVFLLSFAARAEMTVDLHDAPSASDEDNSAIEQEINQNFNSAIKKQKAHELAEQRAAQEAALKRQQRLQALRAQQAAAAAKLAASNPYLQMRVAQNPAQPSAQPQAVTRPAAPAPRDPIDDLSLEPTRPAHRRSGVTLIPTLMIGGDYTESDYLSQNTSGSTINHSTKLIYGGGLLVEFGRTRVSFETGLLYFQELIDATASIPYNYSGNFGLASSISDDATLGYLGIPLLAKLNFSPTSPRTRFNITGGVIPAVLLNNQFDYHMNLLSGGTTDINDPGDSSLNMGGWRPYNVFGTIGIGGELGLGSSSDIRMDLSYRRALMSITQNGSTVTDSFLLSIGVGFDLF